MNGGRRPPRNEERALFDATIAPEGVTTGAGAVTGDSFIDAALAGAGNNSFVSMLAVIYPGQPLLVDSMDITDFDNATGEVTLAKAYKGVAAAIPAGVPYKIVTFRFVPAEVAALAASLGLMNAAATADDLSDVTTTSAQAKLRRILLRLSSDAFTANIQGAARTELDTMLAQLATYFVANGEILDIKLNNGVSRDNLQLVLKDFFTMIGCLDTNIFTPVIDGAGRTTFEDAFHALSLYWAPAAEQLDIKLNNGVAKNTLKEVLKDFFTMIGCLDTNIFTPVIDGAGRTTFEDAFHALSLYWAPAAEQLDIKLNNGVAKNTLKEVLKDFFTMIGCLDTNVFNPIIGGTPRTTFDAAFAAIGTALAALIGATGIFHEQADVNLTFNTVAGSETNVFNLVAASTRYIVRSLRLKFADPGAETITVRLYELVNDGLTEVDSFEVTTANFGTYHSLMDMFGMAQLAGDNLKVTTRVSGGGDIATLGQYSHAKTNV